MAITPLPSPPQPTDTTAEFNSKAFALVAALSTFVTETNSTATNVNTQSTAATTKAAEASTSATAAANSATNAASSATAAASAKTAAESARDATLAAFDSFDDRYLGAKTSDPTVDNDGNPLVSGSLYFNTVAGIMKVYTGSAWVAAYVSPTGLLALSGGTMTGNITFNAGQTFPGTGDVTTTGTQTLTNKTISGASNTLTVDGTNGVGFREVPQNSQSANYTLVLTDSGKHILHPSTDTTARTFTIPANSTVAYPIGTAVTFVNQNGAGVVTISITTDTMSLAGAGTTGSRTLAANGVATAIKIANTEWIISGTGLT